VTVQRDEPRSSLSFDGNDYVRVPDHSSLEFSNASTLSAWVYPTSFGGEMTVIGKGRPHVVSSGTGYALQPRSNSGGGVRFVLNNDTGSGGDLHFLRITHSH